MSEVKTNEPAKQEGEFSLKGKAKTPKQLAKKDQEITKVNINDLNPLSIFIKKLSIDTPILYGLFSIIFAVSLGVAAAFIRKFFSNMKKKFFNKKINSIK